MIKRILRYLIPACVVSLAGVLIYDYFDSFDIHRFRRIDRPFEVASDTSLPRREGLDTLYISGGKRQSPAGVQAQLKDVNMPIYVLDLQSDDHHYLNGSLRTWYGYNAEGEVGVDKARVSLRHYVRRVLYTGKLHHTAKDMQTEEEVMAALGFKYLNIPVTRRTIPTEEQVDQFIQIIGSLPQPCWIHFQCYNGQNRTSVGMMMYDILKNGKNLSMEEIGKRHALLGSENVFDTALRPGGTHTKKALENRRDFLIALHRYVNDPTGFGKSSWKEWSDKHGIYQVWNLEE